MKAAVFHGKEDLRIEEVEAPSPRSGEVKLQNAFNGICGTDLHVFFTPDAGMFDFSAPHPLTGAKLPQVFGHEFSGTVVEVGDGVDHLSEGDRVAVWPLQACGTCAACVMGLDRSCRLLACTGINSPGGGMSEFTTVRADKAFALPGEVDLFMGALVEPMATSWHAVDRGGVQAGNTALVAGAGPIGIGLFLALRQKGVDPFIVEPVQRRREVVRQLGAEHVFDADEAAEAVAELTKGRGVDVAFEAAGSGNAVNASLAALAPQGMLVIVALHEWEFAFNPTGMVFSENTIKGSIAYTPADFKAVIAAMSNGGFGTEHWVATVPLDDAAQALNDLRAGQGIKTLLTPGTS